MPDGDGILMAVTNPLASQPLMEKTWRYFHSLKEAVAQELGLRSRNNASSKASNYYKASTASLGLVIVGLVGCYFVCSRYLRWKRKQASRIPSRPLYVKARDDQLPIVYSPQYNITFGGLENCHPFDSKKWGRVYQILVEHSLIRPDTVVSPVEISRSELLLVHTERYLDSLTWSVNVARITEVPFVACFCNCFVQRLVLRPMRYQTAGSIIAADLALDRGWAINIGGGFHHCSANAGGGFCVYADITLAIQYMFRDRGIQKAMIIDLDAHQGNGHERDFQGDSRVYILDAYNRGIYPKDTEAKSAIRRKVELQFYTEDAEYLSTVRTHVEGALNEFTPDLVVYNAGTDIMEGDGLGLLSITGDGIIKRDEIVFELVRSRRIPIVMVTSGGYQRSTAQVIANSILNLHAKNLIGMGHRRAGSAAESSVTVKLGT